MGELLKLIDQPGSYVSESDFFEPKWWRVILGDELSQAGGCEEEIRSRRTFLRPSRRLQRGMEC